MKARVLALMLSVAVAFSGIPATNVSAAPTELETVVEEVTVEESSTEETSVEGTVIEETIVEETTIEETTEETSVEEIIVEETTEEETVEETTVEETVAEETTVEATVEETTVEETTEEETVEETTVEETTVEETTKEINKNISKKAVGSDGMLYKGVAYLSMKSFSKLSKDAQAAYIQMCDSLAEQMESGLEITDAVISVDKEGNLGLTVSVPAQTVFKMASSEEEIIAENLDLAEDVKVAEEVIAVDEIPAEEIGTLMTDMNYFRKQLSGDAFTLKLYDLGKSSMVNGGRNSISLNYSRFNTSWDPICNALSALISTYPNKFNWVDWGNGKLSMSIRYGFGNCSYTYTLGKSKYYSSSLEKAANKKVKELVAEAYDYAATSYPNAPTYGIIKYFNIWICQNNFYNDIGVDTEGSGHKKEYYYCHSCYGILLKGYGVCESYALAMSRLLDAAGIRNIYVVGDAGGGHAWNYVEMPNGKWYMVDSTWNDSGSSASTTYLLCKDDGVHKPQGARWYAGKIFTYPTRATSNYTAGAAESVTINKAEAVVKPKTSFTLKIDAASNATNYYSKFKKTWSSSDTKVAKVSSKGKVTAVAPGKAVITCTIAGKKVNSTIYVYQFTGNKFADNTKTSFTWNYANPDTAFTSADAKTFTLTVGQKNETLTAAQLATKLGLDQPKAKSSKTSVAEVTSVSLSGDKITLKVTPKAVGSAKVTVSFAGKKSVLNVKVTQALQASWFDYSNIKNEEYTGKAFKPAINLTVAGKAVRPKLTYKVTYKNNTNAGTATVTIKGTGKYGSEITKTFTIAQKDMTSATFVSCTPSKTYNAGALAAATKVKLGKKVLKAGKDYDVYYNNSLTAPANVGTYTVKIVGKGNYKGTLKETKSYEIKTTSIKKVTVSCPTKIKTGKTLNYKVKIGKNALPITDYTVSILDKDGNAVNSYTTPGKYKLVITVKGSNVLPTATKSNIVKSFTVTK